MVRFRARRDRSLYNIVTRPGRRIRYAVGLQEQWRHAADVWTWYLTVVVYPPTRPCPPHYETYMSHQHWYRSSRVLCSSLSCFRPNCTLEDGERFEKVSPALLRGHLLLWWVREFVLPIDRVHTKFQDFGSPHWIYLSVYIKRGYDRTRPRTVMQFGMKVKSVQRPICRRVLSFGGSLFYK